METTNTKELRKNLKQILDSVSEDKVTLVINRSPQEDVIMLPLSEYNSWKETLYLLSTKKNRDKLEKSISELNNGEYASIRQEDLWK